MPRTLVAAWFKHNAFMHESVFDQRSVPRFDAIAGGTKPNAVYLPPHLFEEGGEGREGFLKPQQSTHARTHGWMGHAHPALRIATRLVCTRTASFARRKATHPPARSR